jgi:predicted XRE-type DNA-binding protein
MPSVKKANKPSHITRGDIFDDLGLSTQDAIEAKVKADIWSDLLAHIEKRGLDRSTLAHSLKIHQPDVSNLMRGKLSKFSTAKLITFAVRLNLGVQVKLTEPKKFEGVVPEIFSSKTGRAGKKDRKLVG